MENKFKIGDYVVALKTISFMDNTQHKKDHIYLIVKDTLAYFNNFPNEYQFVDRDIELTAEHWLLSMGQIEKILDYDGWENSSKYDFFYKDICFDEFVERLDMCTVKLCQ